MGIKILIADDDPDIRDILKLTLQEENYEINGSPGWPRGLKNNPLQTVRFSAFGLQNAQDGWTAIM